MSRLNKPMEFSADSHAQYNDDVSAQIIYCANNIIHLLKNNELFKGKGHSKDNPICLLDIGVGSGASLLELLKLIENDADLKELHFEIHGVDPNKKMLEGVDKNLADFIRRDKFKFAFHNCTIADMLKEEHSALHGRIDIIVSNATKHHIPDSQFEASIEAESKLLVENGFSLGLLGAKGIIQNPERFHDLIKIYGDVKKEYSNMQQPIKALYEVIRKKYSHWNWPEYDDGGKEIIERGIFLRFRTQKQYQEAYEKHGMKPFVIDEVGEFGKTVTIALPSEVPAWKYEKWLDAWVDKAAQTIADYYYQQLHSRSHNISDDQEAIWVTTLKDDKELVKDTMNHLREEEEFTVAPKGKEVICKDFVRISQLFQKNENVQNFVSI